MMKHIYFIITTIVVGVAVILYLCRKKENKDSFISTTPPNFNITTDPVIEAVPYQILENVDKCLERENIINPTQYGGLNPKSNSNLSLVDFINTYGTGENYNGYDTADVTSRRYCDLVYVMNNEYFTDRWISGSECELAIKRECEELFPNAPKKAFF